MLSDDSQSGAHGSRGALDITAPLIPVVDIVACDSADVSSIVAAGKLLRAEVRAFGSAETWLGHLSELHSEPPADLAVLVGQARRLVERRWAALATPNLSGAELLAAVVDASLDTVTELLRQGVRGLIPLPTSDERVRQEMELRLDSAARQQPARRDAATHRRNHATLTKAELDVLDLMFEGQANKQIAQKLSIGLRTVELRRSKILRKMGATNLAQLIRAVCHARGVSGVDA